MSTTPSTVLISPLNWGLGHATRCMPIIDALIERKCKVIICANGSSLKLLKQEFPNLTFCELYNYNIKYAKNKNGLH
jgi:predicted glycosyltransferase